MDLFELALEGPGDQGFDIGGGDALVGGGDQAGQVTVEAQYRGLENQTVAVLVAADEYTLFEHPTAAAAVCRQASAKLATEITGIHVLNPKQIECRKLVTNSTGAVRFPAEAVSKRKNGFLQSFM